MFSSLTIIGNLGRDAEIRTVGERTVLTFSVAVTHKVKDQEETAWIRCDYWTNSTGLAQYLVKGKTVAVSGRLRVREYEKDGQKRTSVECEAKEVRLMGGGDKQAAAAPAATAARPAPAKAAAAAPADSEIPF